MTAEEVVNTMVDQVRRANEDALLTSQAFVLGEFETLWKAKVDDVKRQIEARYAAPRANTQ